MSATAVSQAGWFAAKTVLTIVSAVTLTLSLLVIDARNRELKLQRAKACIVGRRFKPTEYWVENWDDAMVSKIFDIEETADQKFDVLGLRNSTVRDGIAMCLRKTKHKDLLVISSWCIRPNELKYLKEFSANAGFRRLLIIGRGCDWVSVEYDSAYSPTLFLKRPGFPSSLEENSEEAED